MLVLLVKSMVRALTQNLDLPPGGWLILTAVVYQAYIRMHLSSYVTRPPNEVSGLGKNSLMERGETKCVAFRGFDHQNIVLLSKC